MKLIGLDKNIELSEKYLATYPGGQDMRTGISPKKRNTVIAPSYTQVFNTKFGYIPNLSIIDLLFNLGPETSSYLKKAWKAYNK